MKRSTWLLAAPLVLSGLVYSAPAAAEVVWKGDFESDLLSQYSKLQTMGPDRLQLVDSPVREGSKALRVEVRKGDDPINASGNRNELVKFDGAAEGTEFYYAWSTLWPEDYPMTPNWQVFMQWHHSGNGGAPPVRFVLGCSAADCGEPMPDTMFFIVNGKTQLKMGPITRGSWHDFVLHIKWSADPNVGFVELWYDGKLVLPKTQVRTMFSSADTNYLKMGLYRDEAVSPTAVLYHDGLVQATTLEEAIAYTRAGATTPGAPSEPTPAPDSGSTPGGGGMDAGAPQPTTPATGGEPLPADGAVTGSPQEQGEATGPGTLEGVPGTDPQAPQAGCSTTAASAAPWGALLGALALVRFRRGARKHRRS